MAKGKPQPGGAMPGRKLTAARQALSVAKTLTGEVAVENPDSATTPGCRVDLIGGFRMRSHDRVVELPLGAQRLVSYLALEGSWVTRAYAAEMLWPDSRRRQAAANLRTALWRVRGQVCDDVVWTAPGRLALADTVAVDMQDVAKEARALIEAPVGHDVELPAVNAETVSRLSMRLLPGWYDDWVVLERSAGISSACMRLRRPLRCCSAAASICSRSRRLWWRRDPSYSAKAPTGSSSASTSQRATGELRSSITGVIGECFAGS
jgi:hypothetical protein